MYIEAPRRDELKTGIKGVFLAGGIGDCPNWQNEAIAMFRLSGVTGFVLFNPRHKNFSIDNPNVVREQIIWEYDYLRKADAILFWFPRETICPIVLYELGAWSMGDKPIFVGMHPNYQRRQDVEIQTELARPDVEIVYSLSELIGQVINWIQIPKDLPT